MLKDKGQDAGTRGECQNDWPNGTCPECGETHYVIVRRGAIDAAVAEAVKGAAAAGYSIGYKEGLDRGVAETRREERERCAKYVSGSPPRARGDIMKKGLCKWCESWERIAASGEVGTCLDPNNPNNLLATECEHPPDYWPGPMPASAPPICAGGIEPTDTWRPDRPASATEGEK